MAVIQELVDATGVAPSYDEIARELELSSKSNVHRLVARLIERGWLARGHRRIRGFVVLKRLDLAHLAEAPAFVLSDQYASIAGAAEPVAANGVDA